MGILDSIRAEQKELGLTDQDERGFVRRAVTPSGWAAVDTSTPGGDPNPFDVDRNSAALLRELTRDWGYSDVQAFIGDYHLSNVVPGICPCGYSTDVEPDQRAGWCEYCEAGTVRSALVLAGLV